MANTYLIQDLRQDWKREFFALVLYFSYNLNYFCLPFKTEKKKQIFSRSHFHVLEHNSYSQSQVK